MSLKPISKGEVVTGSITKMMDRRFLSSLDLIGAGEVELVIDRVEHHKTMEYANGSKDENVNLLYFQGTDKPLALNVTNTKAIIYLLGTTKVKEWTGKTIKLAAQKVKAFGKTQDAVRVVG
jgi:hypothetical protein